MKHIRILIILLVLFIPTVAFAEDLSSEQKALVETADAFKRKGNKIQYDSFRFSLNSYPELATSQNTIYTHCANFVYSVYKNALNMEMPQNASLVSAHAFHDNTSDIIGKWNRSELENYKTLYNSNRTGFIKDVLGNDIEVGDLVTTVESNFAHVMMVRDVKRDSENNVTEITIIESSSNYETVTNKLSNNGLSYGSGGSIITSNLLTTRIVKFLFDNNEDDYLYLSVVRPLKIKNTTNENKYIKATCGRKPGGSSSDSLYDMDNLACGTSEENYEITDSANSRITYSNIDIEKTVTNSNGIIHGSDVSLNEELTYKIDIKNNSSNSYQNLSINETIPDYVTVTDNGNGIVNGNKITWNNIEVASNNTITISYTVKVINDTSNIGKEIVSPSGTVSNIKTPSIKNRITKDFSDEDKQSIIDSYNVLKSTSSLKGLAFIDEVYSNAFGSLYTNSFSNKRIKDLDITDLIKMTNEEKISSAPSSVRLNPNNPYSKLVYTNYYGALRKSGSIYNMKYWEENWLSTGYDGTSQTSERSPRRDTIFDEHFETGDILIYKNDSLNVMEPQFQDHGVYAYIYLNGSFYGLNEQNGDGTGTVAKNGTNEFYSCKTGTASCRIENIYENSYQANGTNGYLYSKYSSTVHKRFIESYLTTLIGKDYYVVIRPSYEMYKEKAKDPVVTSYSGDYDENSHTITVNSEPTDGTLMYSVDNSTWSDIKPTRTDAGITTVYVKVLGDDYHKDSNVIESSITINSTFDYSIDNYNVDEINSYITNVKVGTEVNMFKSNISLGNGYTITVDSKQINNKQLLYTGSKLKIFKDGSLYKEYTICVIGDINGDAAINSADLLKIRQHLLGTNILNGIYFLASDVNYDSSINSADLLRVRQHLLGTNLID